MRVVVNGLPISCGQRTGIGNYVLNLLSSLTKSGEIEKLTVALWSQMVPAHEFLASIDCQHPARVASFIRRARNAIIRTMPLHRTILKRLKEFRLRGQFQREDYSLFHEPNYAGPNIGRPLVTTVCDLGYIRFPQFMPQDRVAWLRRELEPRLKRSSAIIVISHFVRDELLDVFPSLPADKVFVTPLGVCPKQFNPIVDREAIATLRSSLDLPPKFFLFLGTLEPRKNLQGLLSAFSSLPRDMRREHPLVLAGTNGWQQHYFRSRMDRLIDEGSLRITGYLRAEHVPLLLKMATVFCFPSFYEGFGLPALEAAACGTPVLCSRAASLPEVMGNAAFYVDPNSVESIADGMTRLMNDHELRSELGRRGVERSLAFNWDRCARATIDAYRAATGTCVRRTAAA